MKNIRGAVVLIVAICIAGVVNAQEKGFKIDAKTGVQYRFVKHDKKGIPYAGSEFVRVTILWIGPTAKGDKDSVYLDTHQKGGDSVGAILIPSKSLYRGSLEDGIKMMTIGDSAIFKINADSLYIKAFHVNAQQVPPFITGKTLFTFAIKLLSFETKDGMMAARQAETKRRMAQRDARKGMEGKEIAAYLQKNNLDVKPDADSIFYLQVTKGTGPQVQQGDSIVIRYKGTFLEGGVFDPGNQPLKMVYSQNMPLIKGWINILGKMNEGEKVKVLIPSAMAYGMRGAGQIEPYTPLIFDMEVVRVKSNK